MREYLLWDYCPVLSKVCTYVSFCPTFPLLTNQTLSVKPLENLLGHKILCQLECTELHFYNNDDLQFFLKSANMDLHIFANFSCNVLTLYFVSSSISPSVSWWTLFSCATTRSSRAQDVGPRGAEERLLKRRGGLACNELQCNHPIILRTSLG